MCVCVNWMACGRVYESGWKENEETDHRDLLYWKKEINSGKQLFIESSHHIQGGADKSLARPTSATRAISTTLRREPSSRFFFFC